MAQDSINILLAAEDPQLRETLKLLLNEQLGLWDITAAASVTDVLAEINKSSGQAAGMSALLGGMTATTAKKCGFDLVLMDWNMDVVHEFASLKEIRKLHDRKALPVLLITKQRDKEEIQSALVAGATNFLFTPITADLLNKKFQEVLGRKQDFKAQAALSVFQKQDGKEKREEKKPEKKAQTLTGGASYHAKRTLTEEEEKFSVAKLLSPTDKVEGHFHQFVDVVGGGKNCYWAREITSGDGESAIELEYLTPKGKSSGHHANTISREAFMASFYVCTVENCSLARAGAASTDPGQSSSFIDGHYQEKLKSGATNCLWARERSEGGLIDLEYVTPKGTASGMAAKTISREKFLQTFAPCTVENCPIMKAGAVSASPKATAESSPSPAVPSATPVKTTPETGAAAIVEGHYQETIDKSSNVKKCVWIKEVVRDGKKVVQAFLIGPKGRSSGIHDRYVTVEDFFRRYTPCTKENCDILRRQ